MGCIRSGALFALSTILAVGVLAGESEAAERRRVKSGGEVALMNYAMFDKRTCKGSKVTVRVERPPQHGTLRRVNARMDPARSILSDGWSASCGGKKVSSVLFLYKARKGFRGKDRVVLRMLGFDGGADSDYFDITVD